MSLKNKCGCKLDHCGCPVCGASIFLGQAWNFGQLKYLRIEPEEKPIVLFFGDRVQKLFGFFVQERLIFSVET